MIAIWYDIFCEFYVCWNSAITASDIPENGSIESDFDYCETFSNSDFDTCGFLYLQGYDIQW